jgi:hypothetical protein
MQGKPVEGGNVEQDGSHESARRKREDHEDEEHENINKPLVAVQYLPLQEENEKEKVRKCLRKE